jgi:hypothetical protein
MGAEGTTARHEELFSFPIIRSSLQTFEKHILIGLLPGEMFRDVSVRHKGKALSAARL